MKSVYYLAMDDELPYNLTATEVQEILLDVILNRPPRLSGPDADACRERLRQQVAEIEAKGGMVEFQPPD